MNRFNLQTLMFIFLVLLSCKQKTGSSVLISEDQNLNQNNNAEMIITKSLFGHTEEGTPVHCFLLQNVFGMKVEIIEFGAIVSSIKVPDKKGKFDDVVLGYDNLEGRKGISI